jgi:hypothetical protein
MRVLWRALPWLCAILFYVLGISIYISIAGASASADCDACERLLAKTPRTADGWYALGSTQYRFSGDIWPARSLASHDGAQQACKADGGHLAAITSAPIGQLVRCSARDRFVSVYIGLRHDGPVSLAEPSAGWAWRDADGRAVGGNSTYRKWQPGQPGGWGVVAIPECVRLFKQSAGWNCVDCRLNLQYVCQRPARR